MTHWLSNKLKWLSFVATWAVVCIHSRTDRWAPDVSDWAAELQRTVAPMFNFAVPVFFAISGYMFIASYKKYGWGKLLKRKAKTLYVPAVIWMVVGMMVCLPIRFYTGNSIPSISRFLGAVVLWVEGCEGQHFWYVRSLLIMFLLAPVVVFIAKRLWLSVVVVLVCATVMCPFANGGYFNLRLNESVLYFLTGAFCAENVFINRRLCARLDWRLGAVMALMGLALNFAPSRNLSVLGQIILLWGLYDVIDAKLRVSDFPKWLNVLFFVYCIHMMVVCWTGSVLKVTFGRSPVVRTVSYVVLCFTFWGDVALANLIRRKAPRAYGILAGGR